MQVNAPNHHEPNTVLVDCDCDIITHISLSHPANRALALGRVSVEAGVSRHSRHRELMLPARRLIIQLCVQEKRSEFAHTLWRSFVGKIVNFEQETHLLSLILSLSLVVPYHCEIIG